MSALADERRGQVLEALAGAGAAGISGQAIADRLGCSRAAVHRHVEALRRDGLDVLGVHEGYRLGPASDPVVPTLVTRGLASPLAGPVRWSRETGSTNDDMAAAARAGAPEGLVIGTDLQTAGRGRRGRPWVTAPGDALLFSVLLRPRVSPADAGLLPIVAAVAVSEAIGGEARIVWPNDIVIGAKKVCGILCELSADESGVAWVVVGVGINVRGVPVLDDPRWEPGTIEPAGATPRRADVLVGVLDALGRRYAQWLDGDVPAVLAAYAERDDLAGSGVTLRLGDEDVTGTAAGLDDLGRLRVITASGERTLAAGEVTRVE